MGVEFTLIIRSVCVSQLRLNYTVKTKYGNANTLVVTFTIPVLVSVPIVYCTVVDCIGTQYSCLTEAYCNNSLWQCLLIVFILILYTHISNSNCKSDVPCLVAKPFTLCCCLLLVKLAQLIRRVEYIQVWSLVLVTRCEGPYETTTDCGETHSSGLPVEATGGVCMCISCSVWWNFSFTTILWTPPVHLWWSMVWSMNVTNSHLIHGQSLDCQ